MFKYKHILEAMAERAKVSETPWDIVQIIDDSKEWKDIQGFPSFSHLCEYRLKQQIININGYKVPEPLRVKPNIGDLYYIPRLCNSKLFDEISYDDDRFDELIFERCLMHKSKEAAIVHAKALLSFTESKE